MQVRKVPAVDTAHLAQLPKLTIDGVRYRFTHQVSKGNFSTVFEASDEWGNSLVAKRYETDVPTDTWKNEIARLRQFTSPWVAYLHAAFLHEEQRYLLMANAGVPIGRCNFNSNQTGAGMHIASQLLAGLNLIHASGYVHGDINPQNIMIEISKGKGIGPVRLIDLAFCLPAERFRQAKRPMALWMPLPEYLDNALGHRDEAGDIYHAALSLLEIFEQRRVDYTEADTLDDRPLRETEASKNPLARALAPALSLRPADRPRAIELWRRLREAHRQTKAG
jgi:serine/threonine protein kinase